MPEPIPKPPTRARQAKATLQSEQPKAYSAAHAPFKRPRDLNSEVDTLVQEPRASRSAKAAEAWAARIRQHDEDMARLDKHAGIRGTVRGNGFCWMCAERQKPMPPVAT